MSGIRQQIDVRFRQARLDRDEPTKQVIGMLKTKVQVELKAGNAAEETDELWLSVLATYAKQLRKAIVEFEKVGERGLEPIAEARFELEFCESFLPKKLDEAGTETLVRALATEHGIDSPKMMGKLMGLLMKGHRDQIDGDLARTVVQRVLAED